MSNDVRIQKATLEEISLVLSMASLYRYDLSEFTKWPLDAHGTYRCYGLEVYWTHQNIPLLIYLHDEVAGFALIKTLQNGYEMGEFFILRKFRARKAGKIALSHILSTYSGSWRIPILACNHPARAFWTKVLQNYEITVTELIEEADALCVMEFSTPRSTSAS